MTDFFFIRANGKSAHCEDNRKANRKGDRMPGEPPDNRDHYFSYVDKCLADGFIRIGWPNSGDLREDSPKPPLPKCHYNCVKGLKPHIQHYLRSFQAIEPGSVILMPDRDHPGRLYLGVVADNDAYEYFYNPPSDPFECAHRRRVKWLPTGPLHAKDFGISIAGGVWRRAFAQIRDPKVIRKLERVIAQ